MEFTLVNFFERILLPPGDLFVLAAAGLVMLRSRRRLGVILIIVSLTLFYGLSMPLISDLLMRNLETYPALQRARISTLQADAIVILAGGRLYNQPEYGGDTVSQWTLQRVRYGAWLKRRTDLPLYVSGGSIRRKSKSEGELMQQVLQKEFNVQVNVVENKSKTTYENAKFTAKLLKHKGLKKILLVTAAYHMPRAVAAFRHFGIDVVAAPTVFIGNEPLTNVVLQIMPSALALERSHEACHEIFGRLWYWLRYNT